MLLSSFKSLSSETRQEGAFTSSHHWPSSISCSVSHSLTRKTGAKAITRGSGWDSKGGGRRTARDGRTAAAFNIPGSRVRDDQQRPGAREDASERPAEALGIERGEALVEDDQLGSLEQGAGDVEPALLAVRELPARLADHLEEPGGHAVEELAQAELAADGLGFLEVAGPRRPFAAHQEVEGEGVGQDVVLLELRRRHRPPPPAIETERVPV